MFGAALLLTLAGCGGSAKNTSTQKPSADEIDRKRLEEVLWGLAIPDVSVQKKAVLEATALGPKARSAVPLLLKCLDVERVDPSLPPAAAEALRAIGGPDVEDGLRRAVPHLMKLGMTWDEDVQDNLWLPEAARATLAKIGVPAILPLMEALARQQTQSAAGMTLGSMGPPVIPYLGEALHSGGKRAMDATFAIEWLGGDAAPLVAPLVDAWEAGHIDDERFGWTLWRMGSAAKDAVPALVRLLRSEHEEARHSAAVSLGYIGAPARVAVPALEAALATERGIRPRAAIKDALRRIADLPD